VLHAESGEEAIAKARAEKPDLIPDDVVMPGMKRIPRTRTLTRDETTRSIPIIMCTSKNQETDRIWGMRQGALDYLTKPIDHATLLAKIGALA